MSNAEVAAMTNVVSAEIMKIQLNARAEKTAREERARTVEGSRDRLLTDRLQQIKASCAPACRGLRRAVKRIGDAWALVIGTVLVWGEMAGMWVWEWEDEQ